LNVLLRELEWYGTHLLHDFCDGNYLGVHHSQSSWVVPYFCFLFLCTCDGKNLSISYSQKRRVPHYFCYCIHVCSAFSKKQGVFVALKCACAILSALASLAQLCYSTLSQKGHDFIKKSYWI